MTGVLSLPSLRALRSDAATWSSPQCSTCAPSRPNSRPSLSSSARLIIASSRSSWAILWLTSSAVILCASCCRTTVLVTSTKLGPNSRSVILDHIPPASSVLALDRSWACCASASERPSSFLSFPISSVSLLIRAV